MSVVERVNASEHPTNTDALAPPDTGSGEGWEGLCSGQQSDSSAFVHLQN